MAHDGKNKGMYDKYVKVNIRNGSKEKLSTKKHYLLPIVVGLLGSVTLTGLYFVIVSWAESPQHALELFWDDRWIIIPIILGFGVQAGLYTVLKKRLFLPVASIGPSGPMMGAGGGSSTIAMVACCAHHVADVLPILGLTAAATFLAQYRITFMLVGLGTTLLGILIMLLILLKARRKEVQMMTTPVREPPLLESL